jgi:putative ABC transport system permease protein
MWRATVRSLLGRKARLLLTSISIVLGVSFVSGAFILTDSLSTRFDTLFASVNQNINVEVRGVPISADVPDAGVGDGRVPITEATFDAVRAVDGVDYASPGITGQAVVIGKDGKALAGFGPPALGGSWDPGDDQQSPLSLRSGRAPAADDEVVLTAYTADKADVGIGDEVRIVAAGGTKTYTVVGIAQYRDGNRDSLGGETYAAFTIPEAQRMLNVPNGYSIIDVHAAGGVSNEQLKQRIEQVAGSDVEVLTNAELNAEQTSDIKSGLSFFNTFLLVFAGVALFVGAFIIANTFSILVAQRTRELALLRALGASRGQVTRSVLAEAFVVGLLSSAVGLAGGVGLSYGLQGLFSLLGQGFPDGPTKIESRTIIVALIVGVGVTCAAALFPARKAAKIAPVAAMRDSAIPDKPLRRQAILGAVLAAAGAVAMFLGLTGRPLLVLGLGVLLVFLGVALLSPVLSRPVVAGLGTILGRSITGRLGRDNASRNPRRTAATAAALMIGLALVGAIGVIGASAKASIQGLVQGTGADFIIQSTIQFGAAAGIPDAALPRLNDVAGVDLVSTLAFDKAHVDGRGSTDGVQAATTGYVISILRLKSVDGRVDDMPAGAVLLSESIAKDRGLKVGQTLDLTYSTGQQSSLKVAGIYQNNALANDLIVPISERMKFFNPNVQIAFVTLAGGASLGDVQTRLDTALTDYPTLDVQDQSTYTAQQTAQIDQIMVVFQGFLVLAIIIAAIGIVNTLALSVLERTRELGMLRAIGMTRKQVKRMVRTESVIIALFGALLGVVVGVGFGIALQRALSGQGIETLALPWVQLIIYVVVAAIIGVLAAVLPARRAAKLNILNAIQAE